MKIPELKISELFLLTTALSFFSNKIANEYMSLSRNAKRRMFFCPWEKRTISMEIVRTGGSCLEILRDIQKLQETLMESTGFDEDMRPVNFREMLEKKNGVK